ncbi:HEPN domain-containing protein [Blastococcus deserti]
MEAIYVGERRSERLEPWKSLLRPTELTFGMVAGALPLFDAFAPIPDTATKHMVERVTLELAVLANAACLEGLHRGLYPDAALFQGINKRGPIVKPAAEAAADAAIGLGVVSPEDRKATVDRLKQSFGLFNELTFAERLRVLLPPVEAVAPGLIGQDRDIWIREVKLARNLEAHRFAKDATKPENYEKRTDHYYQLALSTEWVLRISVLLLVGVDPAVLYDRLQEYEKFHFALANMDGCRFSWPGSRLEEFRTSQRPATSTAVVAPVQRGGAPG